MPQLTNIGRAPCDTFRQPQHYPSAIPMGLARVPKAKGEEIMTRPTTCNHHMLDLISTSAGVSIGERTYCKGQMIR